MTNIINIISRRVGNIDFSNPLSLLDLVISLLLIVSFLIYMRKFPVFRVLLGTIFLLGCAVVFYLLGFILTALVFGIGSNLILISLPLIFAPEIRHYLEKLGRFTFLKIPRITSNQHQSQFIHNLIGSIYEMAERNIGGTVVITRRTGLGETIETGTIIDAKFSSKLLANLFFPKSPLHDGAVLIKDDRIYAAGCLLPIKGEIKLDPPFGTRHKSGLAITTDTDAIVLIISEQRGEVSLAENGKLHINLSRPELSALLHHLL